MAIDPARLLRIRTRVLAAATLTMAGCGTQHVNERPPNINEAPPDTTVAPPDKPADPPPADPKPGDADINQPKPSQ